MQCHDTSVIIPKWVCTPVEDTEEDTEEVTEVRTEEEVEDEATEVEEAEVVEEEEAPVAVPAENEIVEEGEQQDGEESNEVVDAAAEIPTVNLLKFYQPQQQVYYHHPYQPFAFAG